MLTFKISATLAVVLTMVVITLALMGNSRTASNRYMGTIGFLALADIIAIIVAVVSAIWTFI